jgi:hypothetical protein
VRAAALVALVLALAGCGGSDSKPLLVGGKAAAVHGSLTPDVHLFGEPIVARVEVIVDRDQVSPGDVEVETDFKPYEKVGETAVSREDIGGFTHLSYTTELRCLNAACIPRTAEGETTVSQLPGLPPLISGQQRDEKVKYEFPPALVTAKAKPEDKVLGRVVWPPLRSLSRINWYDPSVVGQGFPFVATVTPLPETTYRISPRLLGLLLLALAVAIVAVPVGYLVHRRRERREPKREGTEALSPLERALALVEWASRRPSVDERREALEALAFELDADADDTAARARAQGWSPPSPAPEEMTELASAVREGHANQA